MVLSHSNGNGKGYGRTERIVLPEKVITAVTNRES